MFFCSSLVILSFEGSGWMDGYVRSQKHKGLKTKKGLPKLDDGKEVDDGEEKFVILVINIGYTRNASFFMLLLHINSFYHNFV